MRSTGSQTATDVLVPTRLFWSKILTTAWRKERRKREAWKKEKSGEAGRKWKRKVRRRKRGRVEKNDSHTHYNIHTLKWRFPRPGYVPGHPLTHPSHTPRRGRGEERREVKGGRWRRRGEGEMGRKRAKGEIKIGKK